MLEGWFTEHSIGRADNGGDFSPNLGSLFSIQVAKDSKYRNKVVEGDKDAVS